ncbi:helix-turn-helix domain-containing protein [Pedobacter steynii]|uniref:Schlafen AlbA-2 domain-containing protein n=1 Tax=Pedobacter steynii TaxID=430522 RepID=A0A1D7QFG5_9SPHI|nr:ATP-binding protein [Pedobacter steynii]AOM77387.1 hypothetical protein BFS30_09545 [Pedobacter steynii]
MTNFAQNLFGVTLEELNSGLLENYFQEQRLETDTLEFKSFPPQANFDAILVKIMKTICGFLNGSGGLLILGAPVKQTVGNVDFFNGVLTPVSVQKSVDWFINKCCTSISPMPIGIAVKILPSGNSFVYVFEVQESQYKPHQVDHIYYIRMDGQTRPAPHYIVQALMRQISYPDLRATLRLNAFFEHGGQTLCKLAFVIFNFSKLQNDSNYNYTITLVGGAKFLGWEANAFGDQVSVILQGAQLIHRPISNPLHYGIPHAVTYHIIIPNTDELKIMITFGAMLSPSKKSIYSLDLINVDSNNPTTTLVIEEENVLFEEKQSPDEALLFFRNNEIL